MSTARKSTEDTVHAHGVRWRRARGATPWTPGAVGEELVGVFMSQNERSGAYGGYTVYTIKETGDNAGVYTVSGSSVSTQMVGIQVGTTVRIVFKGLVPWSSDPTRYFRSYEVWELERSSPPPKRRPV